MSLETEAKLSKGCIKAPREITYSDGNFSLSFRPLVESDSATIHQAVMLSLENLRPFMDWANQKMSVENQLERIQKSRLAYSKGNEFDFSVFDTNSGEFMMSATLGPPRSLNKKALSIGYWTSTKYVNRGLATLTTKILTVVAFDYFGCDRVEIGCNESNEKSMRVINNCNFILEGKVRNYFTEPTDEMIKNGYCKNRTCLQYALVTQDLTKLSWYADIKNKISIEL